MKKTGYGLLAVVVIAAAAGFGYWKLAGNPDALRKIVLEQCLPNQLQHQNPAPCAEVKPDAGYVVFKDRNGPLQYLLMPTYRINGTESPLLVEQHTPNFFWLAWQSRDFMSKTYGQDIPDSVVSLAINSRSGRTQRIISTSISPACVLMSERNWTLTRPKSVPAGCRCRTDCADTNTLPVA